MLTDGLLWNDLSSFWKQNVRRRLFLLLNFRAHFFSIHSLMVHCSSLLNGLILYSTSQYFTSWLYINMCMSTYIYINDYIEIHSNVCLYTYICKWNLKNKIIQGRTMWKTMMSDHFSFPTQCKRCSLHIIPIGTYSVQPTLSYCSPISDTMKQF